MERKNCWEYFRCGRQPGGDKAAEQGVCPAAVAHKLDGTNDGVNGGRSCWAIAGTLCRGRVQGSFAQKLGDCLKCDFYDIVRRDQGDDLVTTRDILDKLNGEAD
ncbi:MAG: hypothetical protein Kow0089_12310 [Desulfobulbaceae bacterium]